MASQVSDDTKKPARLPRKRIAKGPQRPRYLDSPDLDRMMIMFVALISEVSAIRDRLDTSEALVEQGLKPTSANIEAYKLTPERSARRDEERARMLRRIFRVLQEELEDAG
jgi:hypothetical protein